MWWIAGLSRPGRPTASTILRYTETARTVALRLGRATRCCAASATGSSTATTASAPGSSPSVDYTQRLWLLALTYLIPVARARRRRASPAGATAPTSSCSSRSAPPRRRRPPLGRPARPSARRQGVPPDRRRARAAQPAPRRAPGRARRWPCCSAPASPALVRALAPRRRRPLRLGVVPLGRPGPARRCGRAMVVPHNLRRPEDIPEYWLDAADAPRRRGRRHPGARDPGQRLRLLPLGQHRRPHHARPHRPPVVRARADPVRLAAVGRPAQRVRPRLQERTAEPDGARADRPAAAARATSWCRTTSSSSATARPGPATLGSDRPAPPGSASRVGFGTREPNEHRPRRAARRRAGSSLTDPGAARPARSRSFPVGDPVPIVSRPRGAGTALLVAGDGDGLVDAAAAGLIDGAELIHYSASARRRRARRRARRRRRPAASPTPTAAGRALEHGARQPGYTEPAGEEPLVTDMQRQPPAGVPRRRQRLAAPWRSTRAASRPAPRATATRSRSRPRTGRATPSTATPRPHGGRRRSPTPAASASSSTLTEPGDHRPHHAAAAHQRATQPVHRIGATSVRRRRRDGRRPHRPVPCRARPGGDVPPPHVREVVARDPVRHRRRQCRPLRGLLQHGLRRGGDRRRRRAGRRDRPPAHRPARRRRSRFDGPPAGDQPQPPAPGPQRHHPPRRGRRHPSEVHPASRPQLHPQWRGPPLAPSRCRRDRRPAGATARRLDDLGPHQRQPGRQPRGRQRRLRRGPGHRLEHGPRQAERPVDRGQPAPRPRP